MKREEYDTECQRARLDRSSFWKEIAESYVHWDKPFTDVYSGNLGSDSWFVQGELNACYNCVDRWAALYPSRIALIFQNNEGLTTTFTYSDVLNHVFEVCNWLSEIIPGPLMADDVITLYLSTTPQVIFTMLACARLGIPHNVVFGGFSADALRYRIQESNSKYLITQSHAFRGGKCLDFFQIAKQAIEGLPVQVLLYDHLAECPSDCPENTLDWPRWSSYIPNRTYVPWVPVGSAHPLFILYTSGSTGRPKRLVHSTGGYLVYAAYSLSCAFDIHPKDRFFCTADIGWITGHSYCLYGPLCLGISSVILEGLPTYPNYYRLFSIIEEQKATHLYTSPTTIRILKALLSSETPPIALKHDISSIRLLGTVGEPINEEAHAFFSECFGGAHIVDTYFQTETGGIVVAPIPGMEKAVPEAASYPLPGIEMRIVEGGKICLAESWPGIARGSLDIREGQYYTGDEGLIDSAGRLWVKGRTDDVINVSGHRISTAEVESVVCGDEMVVEAAVIAANHAIKGQTMILFVVLSQGFEGIAERLKSRVSRKIGAFCRPEAVIVCQGIPKTATGKLMRRVLRAIIVGEDVGDLSTCINKEAVEDLRTVYQNTINGKE